MYKLVLEACTRRRQLAARGGSRPTV